MKRWKHMNNKGYSMVEMMIVIAIIGVLSALSLGTWRSVENANYRKAVSTLESEMRTLRQATMAQDPSMALKLYKGSDDVYYVVRGTYDGTDFTEPAEGSALADLDYFKYQGTSNPVTILKRGSITYEGAAVDANGVIIQFNKSDGSVRQNSGAGEYSVLRRNGNLVTTIHLSLTTGMYRETY